jgi:hypothetical protein
MISLVSGRTVANESFVALVGRKSISSGDNLSILLSVTTCIVRDPSVVDCAVCKAVANRQRDGLELSDVRSLATRASGCEVDLGRRDTLIKYGRCGLGAEHRRMCV